ncbi:hypothetical protein [Pseudonocardia asaccharolytica]|uniref:hypothetical protein n=1 Tax=Pseudonocardia asaccharolytica TaxID=54010 RepID=UPI00040FD11B
MRHWPARRWAVAAGGTIVAALLIAVPTAVLPTPWFGRDLPVTWWSYPTLALTAILSGLLLASYRAEPGPAARPQRRAWIGAALSWFAVGCPVCNKLALLALGYTGAITWFAPLQPLLAVTSVGLLSWALWARLRAARSCPAPRRAGTTDVSSPAPPR